MFWELSVSSIFEILATVCRARKLLMNILRKIIIIIIIIITIVNTMIQIRFAFILEYKTL